MVLTCPEHHPVPAVQHSPGLLVLGGQLLPVDVDDAVFDRPDGRPAEHALGLRVGGS